MHVCNRQILCLLTLHNTQRVKKSSGTIDNYFYNQLKLFNVYQFFSLGSIFDIKNYPYSLIDLLSLYIYYIHYYPSNLEMARRINKPDSYRNTHM